MQQPPCRGCSRRNDAPILLLFLPAPISAELAQARVGAQRHDSLEPDLLPAVKIKAHIRCVMVLGFDRPPGKAKPEVGSIGRKSKGKVDAGKDLILAHMLKFEELTSSKQIDKPFRHKIATKILSFPCMLQPSCPGRDTGAKLRIRYSVVRPPQQKCLS